MGSFFSRMAMMGNTLIVVGLLLVILVLVILIISQIRSGRSRETMILDHIDDTVSEIRDSLVKNQEEEPAEKKQEPSDDYTGKDAMIVVRIDNRIPKTWTPPASPTVVLIDGRVEGESPKAPEAEAACTPKACEPEKEVQADTAEPVETAAAENATTSILPGFNPDKFAEELREIQQQDPTIMRESFEEEEDPAQGGIRYDSRSCSVNKKGKAFTLEELRNQIQ